MSAYIYHILCYKKVNESYAELEAWDIQNDKSKYLFMMSISLGLCHIEFISVVYDKVYLNNV